jgi:uncharacterized protein
VPAPAVPHEVVGFSTRDRVRLTADLLHGPPARREGAAIVLHGFAAHRRKPSYARLAERLAREVPVLVPDLRGHGASTGRSTLGDREVLDVRAAAAFLRGRGHRRVVLVGASMGATAALRAAALTPGVAAAVVAVSAPAAFVEEDGSPTVTVLGHLLRSAPLRSLLRAALGIRVAPAWADPTASERLVAGIAPTPLLLVHGEDDGWFSLGHLDRLATAAGPHAAVWREPSGFGHAEDGFTPAFLDRVADAVAGVLATGRWPERHP